MKVVKCPKCKRERWAQDNCILAICPVCFEEMAEVKEKE